MTREPFVPEIFEATDLEPGPVRVVRDARYTALPRHAVAVPGVVERVAECREEVLPHVREAVAVHRLDPSGLPHQARHPVRERHEIPAGLLAALEERDERGEELLVVGDDLAVLDLDVVLQLERLERGPLSAPRAVDVERPLRDGQLAGHRRKRRPGRRLLVAAARGEEGRERARAERPPAGAA